MAVVIGQSRATAHVYRMFGALLAMLLIMGVAVAVIRVRADHSSGSPYGALAGIASPQPLPDAMAPAVVRAAETAPAGGAPRPPAPAAAAPAAPAAPAMASAAPAATSAPASPPAAVAAPATVPPAAAADAEHAAPPRQIALGRDAANAPAPQPAPPAMVAAAATAAAAPPRASTAAAAVSPARTEPHPQAQPVDAKAEPTAAEPERQPVAAPSASARQKLAALPGSEAPARSAGRININTASVDQLNSLPGARRIGRYIASHRPYRSIDDLVARRVLKAGDFARIRTAISTN